MSTPYLANEMLLCLLASAFVGGLVGWLLKHAGARKHLASLTAEHDQTLHTTEQELQRVSAELAGQNRRAAEAVAALDPWKSRVEESEAKYITALLEKDNEVAKAHTHRAEADRLRGGLAEMEQRHARESVERQQSAEKLEARLAEVSPLTTEVAGLRAEAAAWERKSRQVEQYNQTQLAQQQSELSLLRSRIAELEPMPAQLVDRDSRLRDLDQRHRATEAALQARIQSLDGVARAAENKAAEAGRALQVAEQQTARLLDERAGEIRLLKHRIAGMEPLLGRPADTGVALEHMRSQLAAREVELKELRAQHSQGLSMAAAAASSSSSTTQTVPPPAPASAPVDAGPLTPAELQGCLQALLFEKRLQFTPKSADLDPGSHAVIHEIARLMDQAPAVPVVIEGHTDTWGDPQTNWQLSLQRAEAVRRELLSEGVEESRLTCVGYGEARPIEDNATPDGRWRNRRIELRVLPRA